MSAEIRRAVEALLRDAHIEFVVELKQRGHSRPAHTRGEKPWECDAWDCDFRQHGKEALKVPFYTGTGHRRAGSKLNPYPPRSIAAANWNALHLRPVAPHAADVLYSAVMDDTRGEPFESWVADFGYDADSRKALALYLECQESTARALRFFGREVWESIQSAVEGY